MVFTKLVNIIFGTKNQRTLKSLQPNLNKIKKLESSVSALADEQIKEQFQNLKNRFKKNSSLEDLLPEVFALVRESGVRTLNMRHYDVQMLGAMILHSGNIAELRTGEGKTLLATLTASLNSIPGIPVHIVTVNDYLARRDAKWMEPLYKMLGLSVGIITSDMDPKDKKSEYSKDIVYATINELGFDYLRDQMVYNIEDKKLQKLGCVIIDEVDLILIDEARTPLIISGAASKSSILYQIIDHLIQKLNQCQTAESPGDFYLELKDKQAHLTESGHKKIEEMLCKKQLLKSNESLYHPDNIVLLHHVLAAIKANYLFKKDIDYIVKNREVIIVDEHTGRTLPGRRWSEGLHQAIEAKEKVPVQKENKTLASITFQKFFNLYDKIAGMTGTADTDAYELKQIYNLDVVVIPTHKKMQRIDHNDEIYIKKEFKFKAILNQIIKCNEKKQPCLIGTVAIETSEYISKILKQHNIKHNVLNAKNHANEAKIIAEAGQPGAVTIATNMAGRGTDIILGGSLSYYKNKFKNQKDSKEIFSFWQKQQLEVKQSGGLFILGTERHSSRRIDDQLRGRSGRQGDPGESKFYLSLDDDLMQMFTGGKDNTPAKWLQNLNPDSDDPIALSLFSNIIASRQKKIENYRFDARKQLVDYENVTTEQREFIYDFRNDVLSDKQIINRINNYIKELAENTAQTYWHNAPDNSEQAIESLCLQLNSEYNIVSTNIEKIPNTCELLAEKICNGITSAISQIQEKHGVENFNNILRHIILQVMDYYWREHLTTLEHLKSSIRLRSYAQKDPRREYKQEAFNLFSELIFKIKQEVVKLILHDKK